MRIKYKVRIVFSTHNIEFEYCDIKSARESMEQIAECLESEKYKTFQFRNSVVVLAQIMFMCIYRYDNVLKQYELYKEE